MNPKIEYVLEEGGAIIRRDISEYPLAVPESLQQALANNATIKLKNVFTVDQWGPVSAVIAANAYSYWTVPVKRIMLRSVFKPVDSVFVPLFDSKEAMTEMRWVVPETMRVVLFLVVRCTSGVLYRVEKSYLYAVDERPECWRLPLPNVYDDGAVCEGRKPVDYNTVTEAILNMLQTFDKSRWNADLWSDVEKTQNMFRFTAKDGGFETAKINANSWILLCRKVVVDAQKNIVL